MIPFWVRRLCSELDKLKIVYRYKCHHDRIDVWYKTSIKRCYIFKKSYREYRYSLHISKNDGDLKSTIPIGHQFQWYPLDLEQKAKLEPYFKITKAVLNQSSIMQKEILIHELLQKFMEDGWIPCYYEPKDIVAEKEKLKTYDKVFTTTIFDTCKRRLARPIIESYFNIADLPRKLSKPHTTLRRMFSELKATYVVLQKLIKDTDRDVTMQTVTAMFYVIGFGPKWVNPAFYRVLFKQLKFDNTRIFSDPTPYVGSKFIATSLMGARYAPETLDSIQHAIDRDISFILDFELIPFGSSHDILLIDNNFKQMELDVISKYMDMSWKDAILFVKKSQAQKIKRKYPPTRIFRVKTRVGKNYDYLFIYSDSNIV